MSSANPRLDRSVLLEYFLEAACPRSDWLVGMELEKMGRVCCDGRPLPYGGDGASVRAVLEFIQARRGGTPILEGDNLIGLVAPWGTISLEPGGQIEWSSQPRSTLEQLNDDLQGHLAVIRDAIGAVGVCWVEQAVEPQLPLSDMPWMPKARYEIMRPYLGARGRLAHRMMTQTASIQCAFDYADPTDWKRKFLAACKLAPVAVALFGNSSRIDGRDSGYVSFREHIWGNTDPDRCGLPRVIFDASFDMEQWLDHVLSVPTIFRHLGQGLVPAGGVPFSRLLEEVRHPVGPDDWETHISTIFTHVRSYTYIEVRSADLPPEDLGLAVPAFWTGLLYDDGALDSALELTEGIGDHQTWAEGVDSAARLGLAGSVGGRPIHELARETLKLSHHALRHDAACAGDRETAPAALEALARHHGIEGLS